MPTYHKTRRADEDLKEIYRYTRRMWGRAQAVRYIPTGWSSVLESLPTILSQASRVRICSRLVSAALCMAAMWCFTSNNPMAS
jgi:hypothetical protein